jgi:hypothetical protein
MRTISLLISIDFDCFRVLFIVRVSKLNCLLIAYRCQLHAAGKGNFFVILLFFNNLHFNYKMYPFLYIHIHMLEVRVKQLERQAAEKEVAKEAAEKEAAGKEAT